MMRAADSPLLTDLYQLTMMQAYLEHGMCETAVFDFFVRKLPEARGFLMFAGLEQALQYLEALHFSEDELAWLAACGRFSRDFVDYLAGISFDGDVHAMPEGSIFFADEPVLRVTAPMPVAQLVESRLINILQFQTLIASKAARVKLAAPDKLLVDFGLRRTHEAEAGLMAARASFIAGFSGTSTVLAGPVLDIPIFGTMAHSFVLAHESEEQAFIDFARTHPANVVLLIDTFDTEKGAEKVVKIAPQLQSEGIATKGVRLDSGDLAAHAKKVRKILDAGGLSKATIFASGNLDEYELQRLAEKSAPIDGFGVGTRMNTSSDAPYLDCAYKLQEYAGIPRRKTSEGKATWPGRKQVYRRYEDGEMTGDVLTLEDDTQDVKPLIEKVMEGGEMLVPYPSLATIRERAAAELTSLPAYFRNLETKPAYSVEVSTFLRKLAKDVDRRLKKRSEDESLFE
ncbi:MAG: nicotinate phosphoribosyltransferase [Mariprofundaceae bacterium]